MLSLLHDYLLHYHTVSIPEVGTIYIRQEAAKLNFTDRLLFPPTFRAEVMEAQDISEHQLNFLISETGYSREQIESELLKTGQLLQRQIGAGDVSLLRSIEFPVLAPVHAERVSRENPEHQVLVGDRHYMKSSQTVAVAAKKKKSRHLVWWLILAAGLAFIIYLLTAGKFSVYSFGLRSAP